MDESDNEGYVNIAFVIGRALVCGRGVNAALLKLRHDGPL